MQNFYIYTFYFLFFLFFLGLGPAQPTWAGLGPAQPTWAGLGPASPARPLAQASGPAGLSSTRALTRACCYTVQVN